MFHTHKRYLFAADDVIYLFHRIAHMPTHYHHHHHSFTLTLPAQNSPVPQILPSVCWYPPAGLTSRLSDFFRFILFIASFISVSVHSLIAIFDVGYSSAGAPPGLKVRGSKIGHARSTTERFQIHTVEIIGIPSIACNHLDGMHTHQLESTEMQDQKMTDQTRHYM